ncbi:MAG: yfcG [Labilithrix sp.]|nr:yfcG [Labilithrix sp.]
MKKIELYAAPTPNGKKIPIALEELGLAYDLRRIDFAKKEQKSPEFLAINPNGKIPALVDHDVPGGPVTLFESGAILLHLATKAGKLLGGSAAERGAVLSWTFWQAGGPGPMFGQAGAFGRESPRNEAAYEKFLNESKRLAKVLDDHLADGRNEWVAGPYSIADIMLYPWFEGIGKLQPAVVDGLTAVAAWTARMGARPAVQRGMAFWEEA